MSPISRYVDEEGLVVDVFKETRITLQSDLGDRFDCNYRNPEYFKTMKELEESCGKKSWQLKKVGEVEGLRVNEGSTPRGRENFSFLSGIPFIKTKNVYKGHLKTDNLDFLTEEAHRKKITNVVRDGDILLTIIGANFEVIGRAYLFNHNDLAEIEADEANINQNIARLSDIPEDYNADFLENFLNSSLGQVQIRRFSKQSAQVNLSTNEVTLIKIPKPPKPLQERIAKIVSYGRETARRTTLECDTKIEQLDQELMKIANVDLSSMNGNVRSYQSKIGDQLNAIYYHPRYVKLYEALRKQEKAGKIEIKRLGDISPHIDRKFILDKEEEYRYVELGDVDARKGKIISYTTVLGSDLPSRAKWEIRESDLLVPTLRGSSKNVALVDKDFDGCLASSGFVLFSPQNEEMRYYLFALLRSPIVQMQYEQKATGSIMADVSLDVLENFSIPVPTEGEALKSLLETIRESMMYVAEFYDQANKVIQKTESTFNDVILGKTSIEQAEKLATKQIVPNK